MNQIDKHYELSLIGAIFIMLISGVKKTVKQ